MTELATPQTAARILNRYARQYSAGAFATPTASDMSGIMARGGWHEYPGVSYTSAWLKRESRRQDWTGRAYAIPAGTEVVSHMAAEPEAKLPDLSGYGRVYAYVEDRNVTAQMIDQHREVCAVRISAASEIIACWGRRGSAHHYPSWDTATLTRLPDPIGDLGKAAREASGLRGWLDDFPFYSDGSWSALSLRGFKPDDPTWGIKPSEMSRKWKEQNMVTLGYTCGWTMIAEYCPAIVDVINRTFTGLRLERVRLLRMAAPKPGKTVSRLSRHTDITDKGAGTRNGLVMRFHIPLVTHPDSRMIAWNLHGQQASQHLGTGSCWYLDARKPHAVAHSGPVNRIHLVVDVLANSLTREMVTHGQEARSWT